MSRRQRWLLVGLVGLVFVGLGSAVGVLVRATATPAQATRAAVQVSTARAFHAPFESECSGSDDLQCWVSDEAGSGGSPYRVVVNEEGCWNAALNGPQGGEQPMPDLARGCVTRYDHWVSRFPALMTVPL